MFTDCNKVVFFFKILFGILLNKIPNLCFSRITNNCSIDPFHLPTINFSNKPLAIYLVQLPFCFIPNCSKYMHYWFELYKLSYKNPYWGKFCIRSVVSVKRKRSFFWDLIMRLGNKPNTWHFLLILGIWVLRMTTYK